MQHYVCGFLFSPDRSRVLLIRKNRPVWQAGKLNGVGGKVEPGEMLQSAMHREFHEETAINLAGDVWQHVLTLNGSDDAGARRAWAGHFFRAFGEVDQAVSVTDEFLEVHSTALLPADTIQNLRWIIPLLLDDQVCSAAYRVEIVVRQTDAR